ncbi:hypothetical protein PRIC2_012958 [Phytophthora ramorum]
MGKEELLDALAGLQTVESVEGLTTQFAVVHEALSDIHRKRWRFLEDSCSVALRQVFRLASSSDDEVFDNSDSGKVTISTTEGINLCLKFIEPLIQSTVIIVDTVEDQQEATNQRAVLVAALLHLFAKIPVSLGDTELWSRLVTDILTCGVEVHVIFATLRFQEELVECRRALLPSHESDSESEMDSDADDGMLGETTEFVSEDMQWIGEKVSAVWGLKKYRYFLQTSGQEYAFAAWSYRGIGNFVHALLTDEQHGANVLSPVVSPFSWLFHIAAYAHYMIYSEDHVERFRGLELLRVVVGLCPLGKLVLPIEKGRDSMGISPQSFRGQAASFRDRDWVSPLIQVITNAIVSFPEATDRSATLSVLKELIFKIEIDDRFWLMRSLIMKCPYGNVGAVLMDFVRGDAVQVWSSSEMNQQSPFKTTAICFLLQDTLGQTAERDLVLHADLIASCLGLLRFLYIRDKDNETGVRTKTSDCSVWKVLTQLSKRLRVKIEDTAPSHGVGAESHSAENDFMHLMILEAALGSTLEICVDVGRNPTFTERRFEAEEKYRHAD